MRSEKSLSASQKGDNMIRFNRYIGLILLIAIVLSHSVVAHTDKIPSPRKLQSAEFGNQIRYFDTDSLPFYLFLTIILESFFAGMYVFFAKLSPKVILLVVLANIVLYPFAWLTFPRLPVSYESVIFMVEVFAVVSEAVFMYLLAKAFYPLSFRHAFIISFLMNMGSFLSGFLI